MSRKTPLVKSLELAISALQRVCHENYYARADAARYGLNFGENARANYEKYQTAISMLKVLIEKLNE